MEKLRKKPFYQFSLYQWFVESITFGIFLLIVPMILVGVFLDGRVFHVVYGYFFLGQMIFIYYIIKISTSVKPSLILDPKTFTKEREYLRMNQLFVNLVLGIIFLNLLYPIRGWDALEFYFPNALYFYLEDDIPNSLNPFSLYPSHKPPLNTLLISFQYYVTGQPNAPYIPIIFLVGLSFLIIIFSLDLGLSKKYALAAACIFLTLPAVYFVTIEYAYYQELPVSFFVSLSIVYYNKALKSGDTVDFFISGIGISLGVFSKLSGFTLPILFIACFTIHHSRWIKSMRIIIILLLMLYLSYKITFEIYIGFLPIVLFLGTSLIYGIQKESHRTPEFGLTKHLYLFSAYTASLLVWLYHMLKFDPVVDGLYELYFGTRDITIQWSFSFNRTATEVYLENAHAVSPLTTAFPILLGSQFTLFLLVPKIIGFRKAYSDHWILYGWTCSFYILWITYHAQVSVRYLSIIWVPFSIIIVIGLKQIIEYFQLQEVEDFILLFAIGLNLFFYYPFIPIEFVANDFHHRLIHYHESMLRLFLYVTIFSSLIFAIFRNLSKRLQSKKSVRHNKKRVVEILLILLIGFAPISFQLTEYVTNGFDAEQFQETWVYDNRPAVRELINKMISLDLEVDEITISVNIPGLGYRIQRPVIDVLTLGQFTNETLINVLHDQNSTRTLEEFIANNIHYIITLLEANNFYPTFNDVYSKEYPFFSAMSNQTAQMVFRNSEFVLWGI